MPSPWKGVGGYDVTASEEHIAGDSEGVGLVAVYIGTPPLFCPRTSTLQEKMLEAIRKNFETQEPRATRNRACLAPCLFAAQEGRKKSLQLRDAFGEVGPGLGLALQLLGLGLSGPGQFQGRSLGGGMT